MCRYKPLLLVVHFYIFQLIITIPFILAMYMYFGGFYPSRRFRVTWIWSMMHYISSFILAILIEIIMYKEILNRWLNQTCLCLTVLGALSAGMLTAVIWPTISKKEFTNFMVTQIEEDRRIPAFIEWLQFTQDCCGIDNYRDYAFYSPPVKTYVEYHKKITGSRLDPNIPNARKLKEVTFNVPRSCCSLTTRQNRLCGYKIKYNDQEEIDRRINNVEKGCYKTFHNMIYQNVPTQVTYFFNVYKGIPISDALLHILIAIVHGYYYDKSLKNLHAREYRSPALA